MSFIQRELDRISDILNSGELKKEDDYKALYAAQQALGWVLDPTATRSPFNMIMGVTDDATNGLVNATLNEPTGLDSI